MSVMLALILIAFCVQALVKFAVWFLVPYPTRIRRIASYYQRGGRIIGIYDTITLATIVIVVVLLFLTGVDELSFVTGLIAGMLVIQIFFHRFSEPLPENKAPESSPPPRKIMSYAIQAHPALAWREIVLMTALLGWALCALIAHLVGLGSAR
jgi:hypothetical protein